MLSDFNDYTLLKYFTQSRSKSIWFDKIFNLINQLPKLAVDCNLTARLIFNFAKKKKKESIRMRLFSRFIFYPRFLSLGNLAPGSVPFPFSGTRSKWIHSSFLDLFFPTLRRDEFLKIFCAKVVRQFHKVYTGNKIRIILSW